MRKISHLIPKTVYPAARLVMGILLPFALVSCSKQGAGGKPADVDYYTCSMHPSVKKQNPTDKCPICSMDLVPVKKKGSASSDKSGEKMGISSSEHAHIHEGQKGGMPNMPGMAGMEGMRGAGSVKEEAKEGEPSEFSVPVARQQQIGVTYATIEKRPFMHTVRAVGMVAYDKQRHWDYVTRVEGYVKNLFVFSRGERDQKDATLPSIYRPDLLTTQNECVDVVKTRDDAPAKNLQAVLDSSEHLV